MSVSRIVLSALLLIATATGLGGVRLWRESQVLKVELMEARARAEQVADLRRENGRLASQQVSNAELQSLRADHEALLQLRAELEALKPRS